MKLLNLFSVKTKIFMLQHDSWSWASKKHLKWCKAYNTIRNVGIARLTHHVPLVQTNRHITSPKCSKAGV